MTKEEILKELETKFFWEPKDGFIMPLDTPELFAYMKDWLSSALDAYAASERADEHSIMSAEMIDECNKAYQRGKADGFKEALKV
jgi:hypothetical protein